MGGNHVHGTSRLKQLLIEVVDEYTPNKIALLFSGGIDSTLISKLLQITEKQFKCYTAGVKGAQDPLCAKKVAKLMNLDFTVLYIDVEKYLAEVVKNQGEANIMKVGVAMPEYVCCEQASKDGLKVVISGLGTEELFGGYQRHYDALKKGGVKAFKKEMEEGLKTIWERDVKRDLKVSEKFSLELRTPFLDQRVIEEAMKIPAKEKIGKLKKGPLREIARELGIPEEVCIRPKKAAQYGSGVEKEIRKLAKKEGFKKWEVTKFLESFLGP
jgi:asparagine synthase (glutamine-hydrolysing)